MSNRLMQCKECGVDYPSWCFEKVGRRSRKKLKLGICQSCQVKAQSLKMGLKAESMRKHQVRSRDNSLKHAALKRRLDREWEEGKHAQAGRD